MSEMKKAGDILKTFFDRSVLAEGEKYLRFFGAWDQIVGPDISAHAKAVDIVHGSVVVEVDHPGWLQMLQLREQNVLQALHRRFPDLKITGMRYRLVDPGHFSPPGSEKVDITTRKGSTKSDSDADDRSETTGTEFANQGYESDSDHEALDAIGDDTLREGLKRLGDALRLHDEDL